MTRTREHMFEIYRMWRAFAQILVFHSLHDIRSSLTPYQLNSLARIHRFQFWFVLVWVWVCVCVSSVDLTLHCRLRPLSSTRKQRARYAFRILWANPFLLFFLDALLWASGAAWCGSHDNYISLGFWFASELIEFFLFISHSIVSFVWHFIDSMLRTHSTLCSCRPDIFRYNGIIHAMWRRCRIRINFFLRFFVLFIFTRRNRNDCNDQCWALEPSDIAYVCIINWNWTARAIKLSHMFRCYGKCE